MERLIGVVLATFLVSSCASGHMLTEREKMDSWLQHEKAELLMSWGAPTRVTSDGKDGEILIYEFDYTGQKTVQTNPPMTEWIIGKQYQTVKTGYVDVRSFWVDRGGKIYYWRIDSR